MVSQPCWVEVDLSWGWLKLGLIRVEVDWGWGWLKLRLVEVEVDWNWGWLKLRLIENKLNLCYNLWYIFEVSSYRLITFILFDFLSYSFWFCGYSGHFELFWALFGCLVVDVSWGWLKLRLIKVKVDRGWGWFKLRLIEVEVDIS